MVGSIFSYLNQGVKTGMAQAKKATEVVQDLAVDTVQEINKATQEKPVLEDKPNIAQIKNKW